MPKAAVKKAARKNARSAPAKPAAGAGEPAAIVEAPPAPEQPPVPSEMKLEPPTKAVETREEAGHASVQATPSGGAVNIAKLQAMAMPDLNHMARDMGIENFGTMRKHEIIFQILQKNAERAGVLKSAALTSKPAT